VAVLFSALSARGSSNESAAITVDSPWGWLSTGTSTVTYVTTEGFALVTATSATLTVSSPFGVGGRASVSGVSGLDTRDRSSFGVSPAITVDARSKGPPEIVDVCSDFCDAATRAYFLDGVYLETSFAPIVEWNEHPPGEVVWFVNGVREPAGTAVRHFDMGRHFGMRGTLRVQAVSEDGERSVPHRVNFRILPRPLDIAPWRFAVSRDDAGRRKVARYTVDDFQVDLYDEGVDRIPNDDSGKWIPGFTRRPFHPVAYLQCTLTVLSSGVCRWEDVNLAVDETNILRLPLRHYFVSDHMALELDSELDLWRRHSTVHVLSYATTSMSPDPALIYFAGADLPVEFGGKVTAGASGYFHDNGPVVSPDRAIGPGWLDAEATAEFLAGWHVNQSFALEGELGGGAVMEAPYPAATNLQVLGVDMSGALTVIFKGFDYETDISYRWWPVGEPPEGKGARARAPDGGASAHAVLSDPDPRLFRPVSRDYLAAFGGGTTTAAERSGLAGNAPKRDGVVGTGVYPYSEPALAVSTTHRALLWLSDDAGRAPENRTKLVWQDYDGSGWSGGAAVWDDGTADFAPEVGYLSTGRVMAVWENTGAVLTNGSDLAELLAELEIAYGVRDLATGVWVCTNLTDNDALDHAPALGAATNGRALLLWRRNRDINPLGSALEPNSLWSTVWNGSSWSAATPVASNLGMIVWGDLAFDGAEGVYVFAVDGDDDQTTVDDQELYACVYEAAAWSGPTRLTTNSVCDTHPQVVRVGGRSLLAWYQDGRLLSHTNLALGDGASAGTVTGVSSVVDFRLATGPSNQQALVWVQHAEDGSGPDPFVLYHDGQLGMWSRAARLHSDNSFERSFCGSFDASGALVLAYNSVEVNVDSNGVPRFGRVDMCVSDYRMGIDLGMGRGDIRLSTNAVPGQFVDVTVAAHNYGEAPATNVEVALYLGRPGAGGIEIESRKAVPVLVGAGHAEVIFAWNVPTNGMATTLYAVVDPDGRLADRNRANNMTSLGVLQPDLLVSDATATEQETNSWLLAAAVVNDGTAAVAFPTHVRFFRGSTNGPVLGSVSIPRLSVAERAEARLMWDQSGHVPTTGYETVWIVADARDYVEESSEANNVRSIAVLTTLDADGDGLRDGLEPGYSCSAAAVDSDADGLSDGDEVYVYGTDPGARDSDGDGASDAHEVLAGTDPFSTTDFFGIVGSDWATNHLFRVRWNGRSGLTYRVEIAADLVGVWSNAPAGGQPNERSLQVAVSNGVMTYLDAVTTPSSNVYYRVRLAP